MTVPDYPLSARGLCFAYGAHDVLHDVQVAFPQGSVTAVAGTNGSGKSTLIELLAGVRVPRRGRALRHGTLALVVQRPLAPDALPMTVHDAVSMGTWARSTPRSRVRARTAVENAIGRVGLTGLEDHPLADLSGGQRQRALLAQGIVQGADILLLDEPAAGLDTASRERTRQILIEEARHGATIVCVTHDEESVASADHVLRLESGRVVEPPPLDASAAEPGALVTTRDRSL